MMTPECRVRVRGIAAGLAVGALVASATACGYKLAGGNTFLPQRIKIIMVAPFENRTTRPEVEQRITEDVANELTKRGGYRVVTNRTEAHALLEGAVLSFQTNPVQFDNAGRATRVETVVTIQASLRDLQTEEILWSQSGLIFRTQYDYEGPPGDPVTLGINVAQRGFLDQESFALDQIAQGAAQALVNAMFEGF